MKPNPLNKIALISSILLLILPPLGRAQSSDANRSLKQIPAHERIRSATLDRRTAFSRTESGERNTVSGGKIPRLRPEKTKPQGTTAIDMWSGRFSLTALIQPQSLGTGGGDIAEVEPNDQVAQSVSLPVNLFGKIRVNGDVDFFAFQALKSQLITVEPFAARLFNSDLIADIALFDASGAILARDVGDRQNDPLIRYMPNQDEVLIVGIADADDFGGPAFDYILNLTMGVDVNEEEPNGRSAQQLPPLAVTIFGDIANRTDVDFYSFHGEAGQTLIIDVDAEVLGSGLDAEINLFDPANGIEFFYNDQHDGDDSRFNIVLPYTGRFEVGIDAFEDGSAGFYRMNVSLVPGDDAPLILSAVRNSKKVLEVTGQRLTTGEVEVNSVARRTTVIASGTLRAKVKIRSGDIVTVTIPPERRRSNPMVFQ